MPFLSIVIPTFNRAKIIHKTLDSILSQSFIDWECLVVDDFSNDNTKEIIESYCNKDARFHYLINKGKKGAQGARNTGIIYSHCEWIQFFDSDDIMHKNSLESIRLAMKADDERSDVYTCFSNVVNEKNMSVVRKFEWINDGNIHNKLFTGETYIDYNGAIIRKQKLLDIGGLDEDCPSMQEWDTHIRLSKIARYHTVPEILIDYFVGGKDAISSDSKREILGRLYILKKHQREWQKYKESHIYYVNDIRKMIQDHPSRAFRAKATLKLIITAPSVQWISFKRRVKHLANGNTQ